MFLGERGPGTLLVRATPESLGPEQAHWAAGTGNVVEADEPAAMADRDDTAIRASRDVFPGFTRSPRALVVSATC